MKNISFIKKIKLYRQYYKAIRRNKKELSQRFNIKIDLANRSYTVLNVPPSIMEEPYNIRKSDIDKIAESYITDYTNALSNYLDTIGVKELYKFYDVKKVDKYSYLVIYGYSLFDSVKFSKNLFFGFIPVTLISAILLFIYLYKLL